MKAMMMTLVLLTCSLSTFAAPKQLAKEGNEGGHGDEPLKARSLTLKKYIMEDLKGVMLRTVVSIDVESIKDRTVSAIYSQMKDRGLKQDIAQSPYTAAGGCYENIRGTNERESKPASAILHDLGGSICFDPELLAQRNVSEDELVGIAMHEHAHHMGYDEGDAVRLEVYFTSLKTASMKENPTTSWSCYTYCAIQSSHFFTRYEKQFITSTSDTAENALQSLRLQCEEHAKSKTNKSGDKYKVDWTSVWLTLDRCAKN